MRNKYLSVIFCTLVIASLSCSNITLNGSTGGESQTYSVELGDTFTSPEGGYSFKTIPGYSLEEQWGITIMVAPDGDETNGPSISLIGGLNYEPKSSQDVYFSFLDHLDSSFSVQGEAKINYQGSEAYDADLEGVSEGETIRMRVLIAAITSTQQFTLAAIAPVDRWDEVAPYFDAVSSSVEFFEPQVVMATEFEGTQPTELPELEQPDETEEPVQLASTIPDDVPYPVSLSAGKFVFTVEGQGEDATIDDGYIQDQSTTSDFVIGLMQSGDFARYFLSIMLKLDTKPGLIAMRTYDKSAAAKAPTAAIFVGAWFYYVTSGTYEITEITHEYVSGRFHFEAIRDDGNGTIIVSGAFNQIPLVWK